MYPLFDVPFHELTLERLTAFLETSEPEPLLWEAKGTSIRPDEVRRQIGAFANSNEGGYLLLGVEEQPNSNWSLAGWGFPGGEPARWITTCLQSGVRPRPVYDVHPIDVGEGRHVAVVGVEPLEAGPCLVNGTVYERLPGVTQRVHSPERLAELFARGRRAHESAKNHADTALGVCLPSLNWFGERAGPDDEGEHAAWLFVAVAAASLSPSPDVGARLFRASGRERLHELAGSLRDSHPFSQQPVSDVLQDRRIAYVPAAMHYSPDWAATALWTGAVGVAVRQWANAVMPDSVVSALIVPAYRVASEMLRALGGSDQGYVRMLVQWSGNPRWSNQLHVDRGPADIGPTDLDTSSIVRELSRSLGIDEPEPEPA